MSTQAVLIEPPPETPPDYKGLSISGMRGALKPIAYQLRHGRAVTNIYMDIVVRRRYGPAAGSPWSWKQRLRDMTRVSIAIHGEVFINQRLRPRRPVYVTERRWFKRRRDGRQVCVVYYVFQMSAREIGHMIDEYERRFRNHDKPVGVYPQMTTPCDRLPVSPQTTQMKGADGE